METLESYLSSASNTIDFFNTSATHDQEFNIGMASASLLVKPSIENAKFLLEKIPSLRGSIQKNVLLVYLEILKRVLHNTHKVDEIASLFQCSAELVHNTDGQTVTLKLKELFDDLLERADCDLGLKLFEFYLASPKFEHLVQKLSMEDLKNLDVSSEKEPKLRFQAVKNAYTLSSEIKKYTTLNSIAFRCIDHGLRYEIADFRVYSEFIENNLKQFESQITLKQRQKLSKLYQSGMSKVNLTIDNNIIRLLETFKFTDKTCSDPSSLDFFYLVEDILSFNLSDQVIRDRIKSLHGQYKGKEFAGQLLQALKGVINDEPGYHVMSRISTVLKPLKLLSKNEYKRYRRNERIINCHEPVREELYELNAPQFAEFSKVSEIIQGLSIRDPTEEEKSSVARGVNIISEAAKKAHPDASTELLGSFSINLWNVGTDVDVSVFSKSIEDQHLFIQALKVKLSNSGENIIVSSKSLPVLRFRPEGNTYWFNISVNNERAKEGTRFIEKYSKLSRASQDLIRSVKAWAGSKGLKNPTKGTFSGYEWSLMVIGFLQSIKVFPLDQEYVGKSVEVRESPEEMFWKFLYYVYQNVGKVVNLSTGAKDVKTDLVIGVLNPITGKLFTSKVKKARKEGKEVLKIISNTLEKLDS